MDEPMSEPDYQLTDVQNQRLMAWAQKLGALEQKVIDAQRELTAAAKDFAKADVTNDALYESAAVEHNAETGSEPFPKDVICVLQNEAGDCFPFQPPFMMWFVKDNAIVAKQACDEFGFFWRLK